MKKILIFLVLISLISCEEKEDSLGMNFDEKTYNKNRNLWQERGILNYTFSQEYISTSVGRQLELNTIVRNNKLDNIFVKSSGEDIASDELIYYDNITDLYDFIDSVVKDANEQINSSDKAMKGALINVEYDKTYHYPTKISCSGYYPEGYVGGLSITIIVNDFQIN